jgi:hypothetical protein
VGGAPKGGHWVIPAKSDLGRMTDWAESDPELLGELAEERNESPKVNDHGAFKPIVKLVRQIRNEHLGDERPKGLYMEMLTYWVFTWGQVSGSTFAEILTTTLEGIADQLESNEVIADPALGKDFAPAPTPDQIKNAATKFREQAVEARTALAEERCPAAARWRRILGRNGNGWVFPLPEGCDDKGNSIRSVTEVASLGPQEARGFAS